MATRVPVGERTARRAPRRSEPTGIRLTLIGAFEVACGGRVVQLPMSVQRLVVFLALHDHPLQRRYVAGTLWLETVEERAGANLRSALWRANQPACRLVEATGTTVTLVSDVDVDLRERIALAHRVLDDRNEGSNDDLDEAVFCSDVLPDWYDDWLIVERERFHQLRLRALERMCERLTASGRFARAVEAGLAAVAGEPLRESAHRALVKVHIAEGNRAEAVRQYQIYRHLLHDQLGLAPSSQIVELVRPVTLA